MHVSNLYGGPEAKVGGSTSRENFCGHHFFDSGAEAVEAS